MSSITLRHSLILLRSGVSKIDSDAQSTSQKKVSLLVFVILYNFLILKNHFVRPVIDFHYFPQLFSLYHLCES